MRFPFRGLPFTTLGVTQQIGGVDYLQTGLNGVITANDYPEKGKPDHPARLRETSELWALFFRGEGP